MVTPGSSITLYISGHNGTFSCRLTWAGVTCSCSNEIARHISSLSSAPLPSASAASNATRSVFVPDLRRAKSHARTWITSSAISGKRQLATKRPWNVYRTAHCTLSTWLSIVSWGELTYLNYRTVATTPTPYTARINVFLQSYCSANH